MFTSFGRSWQLVKASYSVLKQDKELLWFPVMSFIATIIATIVMITPIAATGIFEAAASETGEISSGQATVAFVMTFLFYFVMYSIVIYFNSALIGAALIRMDGGDPTVRDGFQIANSRLGSILGWAAIAATVGLILDTLSNMARDSDNVAMAIIGQIIIGLVGFAWNLLTFLVIPVLVVENIGPIEAIKRSGTLFKGTWGENVTGSFSMGLIQFLVIIVVGLVIGLPLILLASAMNAAFMWVLAVGTLLILFAGISLFFAALGGIFQAALYKYAVGDDKQKVGEFFDYDMVAGAFQPKGAR